MKILFIKLGALGDVVRSSYFLPGLRKKIGASGLLDGLAWERLTGAFAKDGKVDYSLDAGPWFDMGLISHLGKAKADELKKVNQRTHEEIFAGILEIEGA